MVRLDLGLTEEEYRRLPGRKLVALLRHQQERVRREDWRFAFVAAVVVNLLGSGKRQVQPEDLMPWLRQKKEMTQAEMAAFLKRNYPSQ